MFQIIIPKTSHKQLIIRMFRIIIQKNISYYSTNISNIFDLQYIPYLKNNIFSLIVIFYLHY